MQRLVMGLACFVHVLLSAQTLPAAENRKPFKIQVVDEQTGRGVPLVELRTVHQVRYLTDSAGLVAFDQPGLMGRKIFFHVRSHGYQFPKDGFGSDGLALDVAEGAAARIKIKRLNIAERLYRVTGEGIYRDSALLGLPAPIRQPLLNGQVAGQDSVVAAVWRGKIRWFWGDTNRLSYPLGLFQVSGATSSLPGQGGLDPSVGVDLEYFVDEKGFSRAMCPFPGPGAVWIEGLLVVPDEEGREQLAARYTRMKSLNEMLEHGLAVFDERVGTFKKKVVFDLHDPWRFGKRVEGDQPDAWRCPRGHPIRVQEGRADHYLFPSPYAVVRVAAKLDRVADPAAYEAFTCLPRGSRYDKATARVERGPSGEILYAWKPGTDPIDAVRERELMAAGKIRPDEARYQPRDVDTQQVVGIVAGSIQWNAFLKKWILIGVQAGGSSSYLGEVSFSAADAPSGPWHWAKKIATHEKYSFYNPVHHPFFDQQGGRIIYFQGTYSNTFSGNSDPTPRYDYNQIMYRLDLSDRRLHLE